MRENSLETGGFLAALAHELRGPLGAIDTWARVLASGKADGESTTRGLAAILRGVRIQGQLIEDVAELSRLLLGQAEGPQGARLRAVVQGALELASEELREKRIQAAVAPIEDGFVVDGDLPRLRRLLGSLVRHTARTVPEGSELRVRALTSEGLVQIVLEAPGPGLPHYVRTLIAPLVGAQHGQLESVQTADGSGRLTLSLPLISGN